MNMEIKPSTAPVATTPTGGVRANKSASVPASTSAPPASASVPVTLSTATKSKLNSSAETETVKENKNEAINAETREARDVAKEKEMNKVVSELNSSIQNVQRNLKFSMDKELGKIVINVTDKETDEVVRQIPSEEFVNVARSIQGMTEARQSSKSSTSSNNSVFFSSSA